jgi:hypothetical protein
VKQTDLGEYEENAREKQNIQIYIIEAQLPLKPSHKDGKHQIQNSRGQQSKHRVSQWQKSYPPKTKAIKQAPPQTKANQTKRQTRSKTSTPP